MSALDARVTYENPTSGLRTIELSREAEHAVRVWLNGRGVILNDVARRGRRNTRGRFTFQCGVGYAVIDADLLGGNGDGQTERQFENETGHHIRAR